MPLRDRIARRAQRGFTMMETLVVVSILAVVAMIAVPNVFQMQKTMRAAELDAKAQQIYNAAQYNLTSLESTDKLYKLVYEKPADDTDSSHQALASKAVGGSGAMNRSSAYNLEAEYLADGHDTSLEYGLYAAGKSNETVKTYLLTSEDNSVSQGIMNGEFWIEFSPSTGEVYSVFYFEPGAGETYPSYGDMSANARSDRAWRANNKVGYYGGKALQAKQDREPPKPDIPVVPPEPGGDPTWSDLKISLVNDEELYVCVSATDLEDPDVFEKTQITVSVKGLTRTPYTDPNTYEYKTVDTWTKTIAADDSADETIDYEIDVNEVDVIIDSMRNGLSITDIYPDLVPGVDIDVMVSLSYDGETVKELSFTTNSLYESISDDVAAVSSLRHLRNLDLTRKYEEGGYQSWEASNHNWNDARFYDVEIKDDIEFDGTKWADEAVSLQSRQNFAGNGYNPLASFEPMRLSPVMESRSTQSLLEGNDHILENFVIATYQKDGQGNYIRNEDGQLVLADAGASTGLLSESNVRFQNIRFLNPVVVGGENTGVLSGTHKAGSIRNVHAYSLISEGSFVSGGNYVGGLVGNLSQGSGNACDLEDCSSTVDVYGGSYVGGLAGNGGSYSAPKNCYVGYQKGDNGFEASRVVTVAGTGNAVGGMYGTLSKPAENDHAIANVSGNTYVGGLAGVIYSSAGITSCDAGDSGGLYRCSVVASGNDAGGIAGYCEASWKPCYQSYSYVDKIEGQDNVGGFAGELLGTAELCGARGSVSSNGALSRVSVSGRDNVGGFAGSLESTVDGCYAAVDVEPRATAGGSQMYSSASNYGGFVGVINTNANLKNSYSSGRVTGGTNVGGFIGLRDITLFTWTQTLGDSYSTSNVSGKANVGGFIGNNDSVAVGNCYGIASYGKVTKISGSSDNNIGGFIGKTYNQIQTRTLDAEYLRFSTYNNFSYTNWWQPTYKSYREFARARKTNRVTETHPFDSDMIGLTFPYEGVSYNGTVLPHYGDWYYE